MDGADDDPEVPAEPASTGLHVLDLRDCEHAILAFCSQLSSDTDTLNELRAVLGGFSENLIEHFTTVERAQKQSWAYREKFLIAAKKVLILESDLLSGQEESRTYQRQVALLQSQLKRRNDELESQRQGYYNNLSLVRELLQQHDIEDPILLRMMPGDITASDSRAAAKRAREAEEQQRTRQLFQQLAARCVGWVAQTQLRVQTRIEQLQRQVEKLVPVVRKIHSTVAKFQYAHEKTQKVYDLLADGSLDAETLRKIQAAHRLNLHNLHSAAGDAETKARQAEAAALDRLHNEHVKHRVEQARREKAEQERLKQLKAELEHKGHKLKVKDVHDPEVSEALKELVRLKHKQDDELHRVIALAEKGEISLFEVKVLRAEFADWYSIPEEGQEGGRVPDEADEIKDELRRRRQEKTRETRAARERREELQKEKEQQEAEIRSKLGQLWVSTRNPDDPDETLPGFPKPFQRSKSYRVSRNTQKLFSAEVGTLSGSPRSSMSSKRRSGRGQLVGIEEGPSSPRSPRAGAGASDSKEDGEQQQGQQQQAAAQAAALPPVLPAEIEADLQRRKREISAQIAAVEQLQARGTAAEIERRRRAAEMDVTLHYAPLAIAAGAEAAGAEHKADAGADGHSSERPVVARSVGLQVGSPHLLDVPELPPLPLLEYRTLYQQFLSPEQLRLQQTIFSGIGGPSSADGSSSAGSPAAPKGRLSRRTMSMSASQFGVVQPQRPSLAEGGRHARTSSRALLALAAPGSDPAALASSAGSGSGKPRPEGKRPKSANVFKRLHAQAQQQQAHQDSQRDWLALQRQIEFERVLFDSELFDDLDESTRQPMLVSSARLPARRDSASEDVDDADSGDPLVGSEDLFPAPVPAAVVSAGAPLLEPVAEHERKAHIGDRKDIGAAAPAAVSAQAADVAADSPAVSRTPSRPASAKRTSRPGSARAVRSSRPSSAASSASAASGAGQSRRAKPKAKAAASDREDRAISPWPTLNAPAPRSLVRVEPQPADSDAFDPGAGAGAGGDRRDRVLAELLGGRRMRIQQERARVQALQGGRR